MSRLATTNWGLRPRIRKMLYSMIVERKILYVACIRYSNNVRLANRLLSIQRIFLLRVAKCYKTIALDSLYVLTRVLLPNLCAEMDKDYMALVQWHQEIDGTVLTADIVVFWLLSLRRENLRRIQ